MSIYTITVRDGDGGATTVHADLTGAGATAVAKVARAINAAAIEIPFRPTLGIATGAHDSANETEVDL
ncbi:hypothetical protein [Prescottella equi]|uniref:hypothetical protein n=1 Tax=Rhodococcus hoagii TaxID=43767 RepID=UPI0007CD8AA5|nr:hypothetical protein [Prescottella equi]